MFCPPSPLQVEEFTADLREEAVREQQEQQGGATNGNRPSKTTSGEALQHA